MAPPNEDTFDASSNSPFNQYKEGPDDVIMEIELRREQEGLGFNIRGGVDMPHIQEDVGIFVTKIRDVGAAALDGRLAEGDKILKLNGVSLQQVTHQTAVSLFKSAGKDVKLTVLKDGERKAIEYARKAREVAEAKKRVNDSKNDSKVVMGITTLGALILLGYFTYKSRHSLRSIIAGLFSRTDKFSPISYPYSRRF